jgi:MFS family permease
VTAPRATLLYAGISGALLDLGNALADSRTIMPVFVGRLSSSAVAVGAIETIRGVGFFLPQLLVAHRARRRRYRKPLYLLAGATRAVSLLGLGLAVFFQTLVHRWDLLLALVFLFWSVFCASVGAAQVPYTDVFARVVPSSHRSRLLGGRGLIGGLLGVAAGVAIRYRLAASDQGITAFAGVFLAAALAFGLSTGVFALITEPPAPGSYSRASLRTVLADNLVTLRRDRRFRIFLVSQILDTITLTALPFYVVQVTRTAALPEADVGLLIAANTVGTVGLNPLWGWWGDRRGKLALVRAVAPLALISPLAAIGLGPLPLLPDWASRGVYVAIFFLNGACASGRIVGDLGYLMEISPDDRRAEYSGYLNTWLTPFRLLPVIVAFLEPWISLTGIFALAAVAAAARIRSLAELRRADVTEIGAVQDGVPGPDRARETGVDAGSDSRH